MKQPGCPHRSSRLLNVSYCSQLKCRFYSVSTFLHCLALKFSSLLLLLTASKSWRVEWKSRLLWQKGLARLTTTCMDTERLTASINNFSYSIWRENVCMVRQEWRTRGKEVKLKAHERTKRGHNTWPWHMLFTNLKVLLDLNCKGEIGSGSDHGRFKILTGFEIGLHQAHKEKLHRFFSSLILNKIRIKIDRFIIN